MDRDELKARAEREFEAFLALAERGAAPAFDDFAQARPELEPELRALHSDWRALHAIRERAGVGVTASEEAAGVAPGPAPEWNEPLTRELLQRLASHSARGARYLRGQEIGRGGMGTVREAVDVDLRRTVAIKTVQERVARPASEELVSAHERALHRFLEEAQVTAQLNHPGVVPVFDLGVDEQGLPYFAMARVAGDDLLEIFAKVRRREDGWSVTRAVGVLLRVCETMAYAHSRGVVHRDLKPANVMVGRFGEVYVMDWGLAKLRGETEPSARAAEPVATDRQLAIDSDPVTPLATFAAQQPGTVFYMSPEQAQGGAGAVGPLSDVYSVGAMLYELLAGRAPYRDLAARQTYASVREALLAGPPPPVDSLAERPVGELVAIQEKAMAREPEQRYASMLDLASDLRAYLENRVVRAHRTGAVVELRKWIARNKMAAASIAIGLTLVAATLGGANAVLAGKNDELDVANSSLSDANAQLSAETRRANDEARVAKEERAKAEAATADALDRQREAEAATALAQRRLAESHMQRATLARQRGRWREALAALDDARDAGYSDLVEIQLAQARAHAALVEREPAVAILEPLLARGDLGRRRAEALLIRADLAMSEEKDPERPLALLREARAIGLEGADDAYAQALLAETSPEALEWIGKTLDLDPLHRSALTHELVLLFFLGRLGEAAERAAEVARLYPGDPDPIATRISALALHGDIEAARAEIERCRPLVDAEALTSVETLVDACDVFRECTDIDLWLGVASSHDCEITDIHIYLAGIAGKWAIAKRKRSFADASAPLFDPSLPVLRKGFGAAVRELQLALLTRFAKPAETEAALAAALAVHPEGTLHYFRGTCLMNMHDGKTVESMIEYLRRAEAAFRASYETPAILALASRAGRHWATYAEILLAKSKLGEDRDMRRRALENLEWLRHQPDLSAHECGLLFGWAIDRLDAPDAMVAWVDRWAEVAPDDARIAPARVRIALAQGAFERALELLEPLLARDPDDEGLKKLRDGALAGLAAGAKRLESVPADG
jgi:serine/threonine protein kinase